jgi:hypothetical protein
VLRGKGWGVVMVRLLGLGSMWRRKGFVCDVHVMYCLGRRWTGVYDLVDEVGHVCITREWDGS